MTILSKVKTLIEYAKLGKNLCEIYHGGTQIDLYLPRSLDTFNPRNSTSIRVTESTKIRSISGDITTFGTGISNECGGAKGLEEINLPYCTLINGAFMFQYCTALKTVRVPLVREILHGSMFFSCTALEYVEFGALRTFPNTTFNGCTALHTVIVGNGTSCNMFLYHSKELTQECLHGIIDAFEDRSGQAALTLHIYDVCAERISPEYKQKAADKNINILEVISQ